MLRIAEGCDVVSCCCRYSQASAAVVVHREQQQLNTMPACAHVIMRQPAIQCNPEASLLIRDMSSDSVWQQRMGKMCGLASLSGTSRREEGRRGRAALAAQQLGPQHTGRAARQCSAVQCPAGGYNQGSWSHMIRWQ
jgi:hypothetical protein